MSNFNKVYLMGNLTRDPELRYTPKGQAVVKLGLAVNRRYTTESGEAREEVTFVDIDAWGKQAEVISQYCKKGRPLFVEGRLRLDQWDDKTTGQKRSALKVHLESFQFIGGPPTGEGAAPASAPVSRPVSRPAAPTRSPDPAPAPSDAEAPPSDDDDVPF
jgi:single-strand DNA-binding protein